MGTLRRQVLIGGQRMGLLRAAILLMAGQVHLEGGGNSQQAGYNVRSYLAHAYREAPSHGRSNAAALKRASKKRRNKAKRNKSASLHCGRFAR